MTLKRQALPPDSVGFDQRRDEELRLAKARADRTDRVHRMDAGWSPEAFEVCGIARGSDAVFGNFL